MTRPEVNPKSRSALFCHVCLPIILGAGIYTLWRSKRLLVFTWYRCLGLGPLVISIREGAASMRHLIPAFVLYSIPDALWVYSFTFLMYSVWFGCPKTNGRRFWIFLPLALAVGAEFGQLFRIVPGTFDLIDIAGYVTAWGAATVFITTCCRRGDREIAT